MDTPTLFTAGGIGTAFSVAIYIFVRINHKRLRSRCCSRNIEISIDVDNTTPTLSSPPIDVSGAPNRSNTV